VLQPILSQKNTHSHLVFNLLSHQFSLVILHLHLRQLPRQYESVSFSFQKYLPWEVWKQPNMEEFGIDLKIEVKLGLE